MPSILKEIHGQPEHVRAVFMWTSVVIVFSFVVFGWVSSTNDKIYALINPEEAAQERVLAEAEKANQPSLFAAIGNSLAGLKDNVLGLIGVEDLGKSFSNNQPDVEPQKLPVTE
ncbi:MAG: hypothetical protein Q8Q06_04530 [bacterium]|nr:hypothetical protein [bacterium]